MNEQPNIDLGVAWYRPEEYDLLKALASDSDSMANTYGEWLAGATQLIADLASRGLSARRVEITLRELASWCEREHRPLDGAARADFTAQKIRLQDQAGA